MPSCRICNANNASTSNYCSACGAALEEGPPNPYGDEPHDNPTAEGMSPVSPGDAQILNLMRADKKIPAIKRYREQTDCGLKEAKDYVESLARRHGIEVVSSGGCAGMLMLMFAVLLTAVAVVSSTACDAI